MATSDLWFFYRKRKETTYLCLIKKKNLQITCKLTIEENPDFMSKIICDWDKNQGLFKIDLYKRTFWYYTISVIVLPYILFVLLIEKSATVNKSGWYYFWSTNFKLNPCPYSFRSSESRILDISWKRWGMKIY